MVFLRVAPLAGLMFGFALAACGGHSVSDPGESSVFPATDDEGNELGFGVCRY
jgi:hypothetical protein